MINLCNAFDAIGHVGSFKTASKQVEQKSVFFDGDSQEEAFVLHGVIGTILASIPAENMEENVLLERVAGSMPVMAKLL